MQAPNVVSLIAMLVVVLPAVITAITAQFPVEQYWWAALITGVIGAAIKALQVWLGAQAPAPMQQMPAAFENDAGEPVAVGSATLVSEPQRVRRWLVG